MKKILIVLKNEIITQLTRPSFWVGALGLPLLASIVFAVVGAVNKNASASEAIGQVFSEPQQVGPEGYVDLSGIITEIPESIPPGTFIAFPDEASARVALASDEISAFYIVSEDFLSSGVITYVRPDFNPLSSSGDQSGMFNWVLEVNLVGGDMLFANLVNGPLQVEQTSLVPSTATFESESEFSFFIPYVVTLLFYFLIITSASLLMSNVSKEKENRIMEVLLTSVTSRQLLTGKITGLGIVGLGQTLIWLGTTYTLMKLSGRTLQLPSEINIPFSFVVWGVVFFLLGYAVYASLMAGLGALAPNMREATQATFVIMIPMMIPLFFSSTVFAQEPHGVLATTLSLFPLTAPVSMMARLATGGVEWWQPWLSAFLLGGTAILILRGVAGMFRAQALLSGQTFKIGTYFRALAGKG